MATLGLLTTLRGVRCVTQDFTCRMICKLKVQQFRSFSDRKTNILASDEGVTTKPKRPKTVPVPKITLFLPDSSMTVTDMEHAQRMADRRKLNLIKVSDGDTKTDRATYKLASSFDEDIEIVQNHSDVQQNFKQKTPKLLYISANITKHDLSVKMKNVMKLLTRGKKVKICINLDDVTENNTLDTIMEMVKDVGSIQKPSAKKNTVLLVITPLDKCANNSVEGKESMTAPNIASQSDST